MTLQQEATTLLEEAGLESAGALWRDAVGEAGASPTELGIFVGWLDVAWPSPSQPEPFLRDVVHLPAGRDQHDLQAAIEAGLSP